MRKPIFWFLWPPADPGPLDSAARQPGWSRTCGRGPWRWAFLIAISVLTVAIVASAVSVALSMPSWITVSLAMAVSIPLIALLSRAWVAGTYVSDSGVKVSSVFTTRMIPWPAVVAVADEDRTRWLGLPLPVPGNRVLITTEDASIATHVESGSPDLWLRPQALAAARDRLRTWWRETRVD